MKVTLEPTGRFETVTQTTGTVRCRIWEGTTESGAKIVAHIPVIALQTSAPASEHEAFGKALREVKAEWQLVSFDMRMVM